MKSPVFVVGCPRSGTTLVNFILNKHERCFLLNEKGLYSGCYRDFHWKCENGIPPSAAFTQIARRVVEAHEECTLMTEAQIAESLQKVSPRYPALLSAFMEVMVARNRPSARFWGDKTPGATFYIDAILENHPGARIVYVRRHPVHVVESLTRSNFAYASDSRMYNSFVVKAYVDAFERNRHLIPDKQLFEIKYERLLRDPEHVVSKLCQFLSISYQSEMLDPAPDSVRTLFGWPENKAWGPIRPQESSRDAESNGFVESYLRDVMEQYGYYVSSTSALGHVGAEVRAIPAHVLNAVYNTARNWKYPRYRPEVLQKVPSVNRLWSWVSG